MKNRKRIIMAFVLVACMLIGVGYAAVTDNFKVTGNITISDKGATDAFNEDIRFVGVVVEGNSEPVSDVLASMNLGYTASCNVPMDEASFHITGLKGAGDSKQVTFRIKNFGDVDATLNFTVEPEFDKDAFNVEHNLTNGADLKAGESIDITFTVTVVNSVTEETTSQFVFNFTANSAE